MALPAWDLSDLYAGIADPSISRDLARAQKTSAAFEKRYKGRLASLSGDAFAQAVATYETLQDLMGRLGSYAQLVFAEDMSDAKVARFQQDMEEKLTAISLHTLFFTLEINKLPEANLRGKLKSKKLQQYAPWLRDVRAWAPYQLSDESEKLLHEKYVTGKSAWVRLFDETMARLRFPFRGKDLSSTEILDLLSSKDAKTRQDAAKVIGKVFGENIALFSLITNTLAKDKAIEDGWRGFTRPISSRNVSNYVEDEVVDALVSTVRRNYPDLAHRYYRIKAKWFGKKQLDYWDRNAPLPQDADKKYSWDEARELVLSAYSAFSPTLGELAAQFFDDRWIDARLRPGKAPGAFSHGTVPSAHPYILVNYQGKAHDVMTLAHELGHGVHQCLSSGQGALLADTPLTLAETASVFGEQLAFREMLRREKSEKKRRLHIANKVEDMLNTVVRQTAFCEFEIRLHDARKKGELAPEDIGKLWLAVQKESLGPALRFHPEYQHYWAYIPHFVHTPFYVYAYAFGDCLVNSLYNVYSREAAAGRGKAFEQKYLAMLRAGGSLRHKELLKPFGLDASQPAFWQEGLDVISEFIDELEA